MRKKKILPVTKIIGQRFELKNYRSSDVMYISKIHVDQNMLSPTRSRVSHHNDEELEKLASDVYLYASTNITELKEAYLELPENLKAHMEFCKKLVESSSEFLVSINKWYKCE